MWLAELDTPYNFRTVRVDTPVTTSGRLIFAARRLQFSQMYEIFEHTADLGIRVRSGTLDELFADAATGLLSLLVARRAPVSTTSGVTFSLRADGIEDLLHDWLTELLFTFYAGRLVLTDFHVHIDSSAVHELTATAQGEPIDPKRHQIETEVKAITWHALKVERLPEGWMAEVIVDI